MGVYINKNSKGEPLPRIGKAAALIADGAIRLEHPPKIFQQDLVCVVENGLFDAAAYAYDERAMREFLPKDGRPKTWLIVPNAPRLADY